MAQPDFVFIGHDDVTTSSFSNKNMASLVSGTEELPYFALNSGADGTYYAEWDVSGQSYAEGWVSFWIEGNRQDANREILILSGATSDLFRIIAVDTATTGSQKAQYYNGSSWTDIATLTTNLQDGVRNRIDVRFKLNDTTGEFIVYVDGSSEASVTSTDTLTTADTTVDTVRMECPDVVYLWYMGPLIVDSVDTRDLEWANDFATSDGTHTEWSLGEPYVDNYVGDTPGTPTVSSASGERITLNFPTIDAAFSSYTVEQVHIVAQAQGQADPALYLKPQTRASSTDYTPFEGGSFLPISADDLIINFQLLLDPTTGSAWASQAAVEAHEIGVISSSTA